MVSFIGGLALQVKNKNGITISLFRSGFYGPEKSGTVLSRHSANAVLEPPLLKVLRSFKGGVLK
jgi:hypothetical protein